MRCREQLWDAFLENSSTYTHMHAHILYIHTHMYTHTHKDTHSRDSGMGSLSLDGVEPFLSERRTFSGMCCIADKNLHLLHFQRCAE